MHQIHIDEHREQQSQYTPQWHIPYLVTYLATKTRFTILVIKTDNTDEHKGQQSQYTHQWHIPYVVTYLTKKAKIHHTGNHNQ